MKIHVLTLLLFFSMMACGTSSKLVTVNITSQPKVSGLGFSQSCLTNGRERDACAGDRLLIQNASSRPDVVDKIKQGVQTHGYHQVVNDGDPTLTVKVSVTTPPPIYRKQPGERRFPRTCVERKKQCTEIRGYRGCLNKANQIRSRERRERRRAACDRNYKRCSDVCTKVREAYTQYSLDEQCVATVNLKVVRIVDRQNNAVGDQHGLLLGSPSLVSEKTSRQKLNHVRPTPVGSTLLCQRAFTASVKQADAHLNPHPNRVAFVFAALSLPPYETALRQLQIGQYEQAHEAVDAAFSAAGDIALPHEDVAWIHHVKAATFLLQGEKTACREQLALAGEIRPSLIESAVSTDALSQGTPAAGFARLIHQCREGA